MIYISSTDKARIDELNHFGLQPDSVTKNLVAVIKHPMRDEWVAAVPDSLIPTLMVLLTDEEKAALGGKMITEDQLRADGWFEDSKS